MEGADHPSVVYPNAIGRSIRDHLSMSPDASRMTLVFDVVSGLSYMHQFDVAHGSLNPESVLIAHDERAVITDTHSPNPQAARYSAPELVADEGVRSKAADIWALACLIYEVISGNVPFCQIATEFRVAGAVATGSKPLRPGKGVNGNDISDAIWQVLLMCWEFRPEDRHKCIAVQQIFRSMVSEDNRPPSTLDIPSGAFTGFHFNIEEMKSRLTQILGSEDLPSLRVPEHLRKVVASFLPDTARLKATVAAAKKLDPRNLQIFVDFLDLMLDDLTDPFGDPTSIMLSTIMVSTHVIPRCYKLDSIQYDSTPIFKGTDAVAYKARGLNLRINHVTDSWTVKAILKQLTRWRHTSHPNIIPFYGVFHEGAIQSPRLYVVTPLYSKGCLEDYASTLPQESRFPLISDVVAGMVYYWNRDQGISYYNKTEIMISDEGRAVIASFNSVYLYATDPLSSAHQARFEAPGPDTSADGSRYMLMDNLLKILSRKEPYYQYTGASDISSAISRGELPRRPDHSDDIDEIDDRAWGLIMRCCKPESTDRPTAVEVQEMIASWKVDDSRPEGENSLGGEFLTMRSASDVDFRHVEMLIGRIQMELLRDPLSELLRSHIKEIATTATELKREDVSMLVDFLDLARLRSLSPAGLSVDIRGAKSYLGIVGKNHIDYAYLPSTLRDQGYQIRPKANGRRRLWTRAPRN
ncbi:hypothetical protein NP233_g9324 [Leucocoprinus birnbaumii]|uniref:Protein kinase domain-containing protein n=1 Tax=Leucocoprinus birnbaumii TaxID=56174 RepID=A0AAD5VKZ0_9AGAR|nr:hypothetical protein NP233_g9324 [Leucocoprinus birnbaumii]